MSSSILWILAIIVSLGLIPYLIFLLASIKIPNLNPGLAMFVSGFHFVITAILLWISWLSISNVYFLMVALVITNIFFGFISTRRKILYKVRDSLGGFGVPTGWFWFHKWEAIDTPMESQSPVLHAFLSCLLANLWLMLGWFSILIINEKIITFPIFIISLFAFFLLSTLGIIGGYLGKIRGD